MLSAPGGFNPFTVRKASTTSSFIIIQGMEINVLQNKASRCMSSAVCSRVGRYRCVHSMLSSHFFSLAAPSSLALCPAKKLQNKIELTRHL